MSNYKDLRPEDAPDLSPEELKALNDKNRAVLLAHEPLMPKTEQEREDFFNSMPLTASYMPKDGQVNEDWEAMNALLADIDPLERAHEFKNSGNRAFKLAKTSGKASRFRDAYGYYSNALDMKCEDQELNSVLHCNRALASIHLENYGRALADCLQAVALESNNLKAYVRGAKAANAIGKFEQSRSLCDSAAQSLVQLREMQADAKTRLPFDYKKNTLATLEKALDVERKISEAGMAKKKEKREAKQREEREKKALDAQLDLRKGLLARMQPARFDMSVYPGAGKIVLNEEDNSLRFPVLFLVPEKEQSDFVELMHESHRFIDQLQGMFPPKGKSPGWDPEGKFNTKRMKLYYEVKDPTEPGNASLRKKVYVSTKSTLRMLVERKDFFVEGMVMISIERA